MQQVFISTDQINVENNEDYVAIAEPSVSKGLALALKNQTRAELCRGDMYEISVCLIISKSKLILSFDVGVQAQLY